MDTTNLPLRRSILALRNTFANSNLSKLRYSISQCCQQFLRLERDWRQLITRSSLMPGIRLHSRLPPSSNAFSLTSARRRSGMGVSRGSPRRTATVTSCQLKKYYWTSRTWLLISCQSISDPASISGTSSRMLRPAPMASKSPEQ